MLLPVLLLACEEKVALPSEECRGLGARVDAERLVADVHALSRTPRRTEGRRAEARAHITQALGQAGLKAVETPFSVSGVAGVNLLAVQGRPVLLGAHYDSMPQTPGADDNASGVAVLLEAARLLGDRVDLVFFDAEEVFEAQVGKEGRNYAFGSQAFVDAGASPALTIVVESVGYACDGCQALPAGVPKGLVEVDGRALYLVGNSGGPWADFEAAFNTGTVDHPAHRFEVPGAGRAVPQARFSDHAPFWDAGLHAVMVTDTAILRNPGYHKSFDTVDTLSPTLLADAARGVIVAACTALEAER